MYLKCAHPDCSSDFDYGQGRFYRFQQTPQHGQPAPNSHCVKHFWLCTRCCETFTIDYQKGVGVLLRQRLESLRGGQPSQYVLLEEIPANRKLTRRFAHSRNRNRAGDLPAAQTTTIEILENRSMERRG